MNSPKEFLDVAKLAGILKQIKRTGWVRIGVPQPESVADHSFRTTFLAMILSRGKKVNQKKIMEMALVHDLGESATSDMRVEFGSVIIPELKKAKYEIEERAIKGVLEKIDKDNYYFNLWCEYRDQNSEEAKFLKQVEKMEMAIQAFTYQEGGAHKKLLDEFFENANYYIKLSDLRKIFEVLLKERKKIS